MVWVSKCVPLADLMALVTGSSKSGFILLLHIKESK